MVHGGGPPSVRPRRLGWLGGEGGGADAAWPEGEVMVGSSRRRRVAGAGALVVALGFLVTLAPSAGATRPTGLTPGLHAHTRRVCGDVVGRRARCSAIEVLDPVALAASLRAPGQPPKKRPPRTTTATSRPTTAPSPTPSAPSISSPSS